MEPTAYPEQIGEFRILGLLGEGAMGRVYHAEQATPRREVALKVLKSLELRAEFQQRFRREIELLGALDHPGIAKIYAAGQAELGGAVVPYLAMEWVRGEDLIHHAEHRQLGMRERLALLAQIARAIHHAHSRGVIHHDLKPANILVDGEGQPKILDFGIAHVVDQDATQVTATGEVLGTLPYLSWDQLTGASQRFDPRCDVYALGVIAYELLSGRLPYPEMRGGTLVSAIRRMDRGQPEPLSRHLPQARGDVETLVMKAMAREASQRYASAAEVAEDIERYLRRQPIAARPPTTMYLASLFVRRHRALSVATAVTFTVLVAATAISLRLAAAEAQARGDAERRLAEREAVNALMVEMFRAADPGQSRGEDLRVSEVLAVAGQQLDQREDLPPNVVARLAQTLGELHLNLGDAANALARFDAGLAQPGVDPEAQRALQTGRLRTQALAGRSEAVLAELEALLPLAEREAWPAALQVSLMGSRGKALTDLGQHEAAKEILGRAWTLAERRLPAGHAERLHTSQLLMNARLISGDVAGAVAQLEATADEAGRHLGEDHPTTLMLRNELGLAYYHTGRAGDAEAIWAVVEPGHDRVLGAAHPSTIAVRSNRVMAGLERAGEGDIDPAALQALAQSVHEQAERVFGPAHPTTLKTLNHRAYAEELAGDLATAERLSRVLIERSVAQFGADHPDTLNYRNNLAVHYMGQHRYADACAELAPSHATAAAHLGEAHSLTANMASNYGRCLLELGDVDRAVSLMESAQPVIEAQLGPEHWRAKALRERLARGYRLLGRPEGSERSASARPPA